jgi:uncharacterized peroxidase-related enzyme
MAKRQYGGAVPGLFNILARDLNIGLPVNWTYNYLHMRKSSPMSRLQREMLATVVNGLIGGAPWLGLHTAAVRRLTKDEHLTAEFATTWPQYDLDPKTRALLAYAKKLTQEPSMVEDPDIEELRSAGWDEQGIYEATALISLFNYTGRMEAASGLPMDQIPQGAKFPEATPGKPRVSVRAWEVSKEARALTSEPGCGSPDSTFLELLL